MEPILTLVESHVRAAHRLHGDHTTVPLLARGGAKKARLWTYVRDDRPWLADVLARLPDMPVSCVHELLPWNWKAQPLSKAA